MKLLKIRQSLTWILFIVWFTNSVLILDVSANNIDKNLFEYKKCSARKGVVSGFDESGKNLTSVLFWTADAYMNKLNADSDNLRDANETPAQDLKCDIWLVSLIVLSVMFISGLALVLARRNRLIRERLENERIFAELQLKALRNQLAPHFVFNALNAIGSSIYQNDKEKAYDFLQRFSALIRTTIIHADKSYRSLSEELEFVRNYLDLEKFRFENKFEFSVEMDESIDPGIPVPKMIIQTFAENAVKHGLEQKNGKGFLSINLCHESGDLKITIKDNGVGRAVAMKNNTTSTGKGMGIIGEFISLFNRFNEKKIHYEIADIFDKSDQLTGTCVIIRLPIDYDYNLISNNS